MKHEAHSAYTITRIAQLISSTTDPDILNQDLLLEFGITLEQAHHLISSYQQNTP